MPPGRPFDEPLGTASGLYEFDPATLTQRRPLAELEDAVRGQPALNHERAHWFQFCGTTIGAAFLTLSRLEDLLLLEQLNASYLRSEALDFVRSRLAGSESLRQPNGQSPKAVEDLVSKFTDIRTVKSLFMDASWQWSWPGRSRRELVAEALPLIDSAFALHTGGIRPWVDGSGEEEYFSQLSDIEPVMWTDYELTTRNLFEAAAFLNERMLVIAHAWGGLPPHPGNEFRRIDGDFEFDMEDAMRSLLPRYRRPLDIALACWRDQIPDLVVGSAGQSLAAVAPTLVCCIDIAANPPIPPVCQPTALAWNQIYPPSRFLTSVRAVCRVGVLTRFPSNASYTSYRDRLCSVAYLTVGRIEGRSIQNARFGGTFFHEVRAGDELLRRMSYFDYLVWAIESHHSMKRVFPLHCAIPWLTLVKFGDFPHVESLMDPDGCGSSGVMQCEEF